MGTLLPPEDLLIDIVKGNPDGYEKLSRIAARYTGHATVGAHIGPPFSYTPVDDPEVTAAAQRLEQHFPYVTESARDRRSVVGFESELWGRLRRCAGFDPDRIRIDKFGNVIYRQAAPNTVLAGCIDHYYPVASESIREICTCMVGWNVLCNLVHLLLHQICQW
jgi:hypothetical protein